MAMATVLKSVKDSAGTPFSVVGTVYASGVGLFHALLVNNGSNVAVEVGYANPLPVIAVFSGGTTTDASGAIATGGTAQALTAANANRSWFLFQNNSDADLWVNFSIAAVVGEPSIKVAAGTSFSMGMGGACSTESLSVIGATAGKTFTFKEI